MDICTECRGTQWRKIREGILQRCVCFPRVEPDESGMRRMHLPHPWFTKSLKDYIPRNPPQQRALDFMRGIAEYVEDRGGIATPFGAVLTGPPGTGKTHLAVAYLKELSRSGFSGMYAHYPDWLESIRKGLPADPAGTAGFRSLLDADVVLLDDVAAISGLPSPVADAASALIKSRHNRMKPVILTSRLPLVDPENSGAESLTLELGYPAVSRLMETCAIIHLG